MCVEEGNFRVQRAKIKEAIETLKRCLNKWNEEKKPKKKSLLEDLSNSPIFLQVSLKKIPELSSIQMIQVHLPHSLLTDNSEVCLISGDLDKRNRKADVEPTIQHYEDFLKKHGISCVTKVIPLRQLRTEYKTYEAKRQLCGAYDVFLADSKINQCLPRILGKFFFKKRKYPLRVKLENLYLKSCIENCLHRKVFYLSGKGNSFSSEVAHFGLPVKHIVANIEAAIDRLKCTIPGEWQNIYSLSIKTPKSVAIPLYISLGSGNSVDLSAKPSDSDVEAEEISTLPRCKVKVYPDGAVKLVPDLQRNSSDDESDFQKFTGSGNSVDLPATQSDSDVEAEEIMTLPQSKAKVHPHGTVKLVPNSQENSEDDESDFENFTESGSSVDLHATQSDSDVEAEEMTILPRSKAKVQPHGTVKLVPNSQENSDDDDDESDFENFTGSGSSVNLPATQSDSDVEAEEMTTLPRSKVKVHPRGIQKLLPVSQKNSDDETDFEKQKVLKTGKFLSKRKRMAQINESRKIQKKRRKVDSRRKTDPRANSKIGNA